jgi:hypothetical protein
MPLSGGIGAKSSGNQFTPIVTNNGAFNVKIVPLDGGMEEKPNQKVDAQAKTKIKVGDTVSGEEVKTEDKNMGKVVSIEMEDNHIVGFKILNDDGKEVILDPSTVSKHDTNNGEDLPNKQPAPAVGESFISVPKSSTLVKSFQEWSNS